MSNDPSAIEIKRTTQAVEVMALIFENPSLNVEEACDAVGIAPRTYYYWVQRSPEALRTVKDFLSDIQREELAFLSAAVSATHISLAKAALSKDTEVGERLKIIKYLGQEAEKLQRIYQVTSGGEDAAKFLRDGPQVVQQKSKFASITVSPDSEGGVHVDVFRDETIIDGVEVSEPLDEPDDT